MRTVLISGLFRFRIHTQTHTCTHPSGTIQFHKLSQYCTHTLRVCVLLLCCLYIPKHMSPVFCIFVCACVFLKPKCPTPINLLIVLFNLSPSITPQHQPKSPIIFCSSVLTISSVFRTLVSHGFNRLAQHWGKCCKQKTKNQCVSQPTLSALPLSSQLQYNRTICVCVCARPHRLCCPLDHIHDHFHMCVCVCVCCQTNTYMRLSALIFNTTHTQTPHSTRVSEQLQPKSLSPPTPTKTQKRRDQFFFNLSLFLFFSVRSQCASFGPAWRRRR